MHNTKVYIVALYLCIFIWICVMIVMFVFSSLSVGFTHTHTNLEVLVQHIHHTVFVFFLCVRLFLFFCTYLLTLPKLKHGHWQCTMHRTTISRTKVTSSCSSSSSMFPQTRLHKQQFLRTLAFGIGCYEYVLHICWCQPS